jgi:hypothetical protein
MAKQIEELRGFGGRKVVQGLRGASNGRSGIVELVG